MAFGWPERTIFEILARFFGKSAMELFRRPAVRAFRRTASAADLGNTVFNPKDQSTLMKSSMLLPVGEHHCQPEAFAFFAAQLPHLHRTEGLLRAAIAVSMHALDDVDPARIEQRLQTLSLRVCERSPSRRTAAILANMHAVLFEEEGFLGNLERYYNALNSYVPAVLDTRRGVPVLLSLIYKVVGEWAGLQIQGINAPGHFMLRVRCDNAWMIVDPFFGGQVLTRSEAFERLDRVAGRRVPRTNQMLATATHEQWLIRILGNLRQLFTTDGRVEDLAAMTELHSALTRFSQKRADSVENN
jgi:regulator of sirC expression with transglutaminase-like and TPR domain